MFMKAICLFPNRIKVLILWIEGLSGLLFTSVYIRLWLLKQCYKQYVTIEKQN